MPEPSSIAATLRAVAAPTAVAPVAALTAAWRAGQVLAAQVLDVRADGVALLQIGPARLEARSQAPLQAGQALQVQVTRPATAGEPAVLQRLPVAEAPPDDAAMAARLLRAALPRERPLAQAMEVLQRFATAPRGEGAGPGGDALRAMVLDLVASLPRPADAADPARLAALVRSSGLFHETGTARANQGAAARGANPGPGRESAMASPERGAAGADFKARLAGLAQATRTVAGAAPANPAVAELETALGSALARIEVNQVASVRAAADTALLLPVDLVIADGPRIQDLALRIRREGEGAVDGTAAPDAPWVVEVVVQPPGMQPLHARVSLAGGQVHAALTTESAADRDRFEAAVDTLRGLLQATGLDVGAVTCRCASLPGGGSAITPTSGVPGALVRERA